MGGASYGAALGERGLPGAAPSGQKVPRQTECASCGAPLPPRDPLAMSARCEYCGRVEVL